LSGYGALGGWDVGLSRIGVKLGELQKTVRALKPPWIFKAALQNSIGTMKLQCFTLLSSAVVVSANYAQNLNYRSPSEHHPSLGISIHKVVKRNDPSTTWDPSKLNFTHGVASGDPFEDSVVLWTRIAPSTDNDHSNATVSGYVPLYNHDTKEYVAMSKAPVCVNYKVATDKEMKHRADSGTVYTTSDIDYTVKVEAKKLRAYTTYYYQFTVCNSQNVSPLGRTKTTPDPDDNVTKVGIAVYSCSNFPFGFFNSCTFPITPLV
jgi:alkaline phosphatase D